VNSGVMKPIAASNAPDALKIVIATIIPSKNGNNVNAISIPSFPPSTNNSYVGSFLIVAVTRTIKIKHGINHVLIKVIYAIVMPPYYNRYSHQIHKYSITVLSENF